jgi:hypothetical protein
LRSTRWHVTFRWKYRILPDFRDVQLFSDSHYIEVRLYQKPGIYTSTQNQLNKNFNPQFFKFQKDHQTLQIVTFQASPKWPKTDNPLPNYNKCLQISYTTPKTNNQRKPNPYKAVTQFTSVCTLTTAKEISNNNKKVCFWNWRNMRVTIFCTFKFF